MPDISVHQFAVLGSGAWGTALAATIAAAGHDVIVWGRRADIAEALQRGDGNPAYLPDIDLPPLKATTNLHDIGESTHVLAVVPAQSLRTVLTDARLVLAPGTTIIHCAKGIERGSLKLMTEIHQDIVPDMVPAVLSGPSFAHDVARGLPTAVTLACNNEDTGHLLVNAIGRPAFRPYWTDDMIGVEIGGAVKNVLAIACGIVEGLELGRSAHAALIARGFAEMRRLAVAFGAREATLSGLSGLGDLVLTCSSSQSRNMRFGQQLGQGISVETLLGRGDTVTEGTATAPAVAELARQRGVDMPICQAVSQILTGDISVSCAIDSLLDRPFKEET